MTEFFEQLDVTSAFNNDNNNGFNNNRFSYTSFDNFENYDKTQSLEDPSKLGATEIILPESTKISPAVGWLVCVKGVDKGRSFRLVNGNNPIGRPGNGKNYAVELSDQGISRKGAACVIVYNEKSNHFFVTPGDLTTNINPYLNDEILLSPQRLEARATLEVADDVMIFVPFCCDKFIWKFGEEKKMEVTGGEKKEEEKKKGIVRCEKGHFYNSSIHETCPYCEAQAKDNDPEGPTRIM